MGKSVSGGNESEDEMTPLTEFIKLLCTILEKHCSLEKKIDLDELPAEGGLYMEIGEGFADTTYYNKDEIVTLPVLFLCRDVSQERGMEQLWQICNYLRKLKKYPGGETFSWLDARVTKEPNKIGRDEDKTYLFSCIISCRICF